MSNGSPWAQSEKDRERSSRIKARNMQMDAIESSEKRSFAKAVGLVILVVVLAFAGFLGVLWAIVAVVRSAWGS